MKDHVLRMKSALQKHESTGSGGRFERRSRSAERLFLMLPFVALSWTIITGCGSSQPATVSVSGRITYAGKPVSTGQIMFQPEQGQPAMGEIDADGRYTLSTFKPGDGAVLGKHCVTIEAKRESGGSAPKSRREELSAGYRPPVVQRLVPEKYAYPETTTLTAEVTSDTKTIDFDLPANE